MSDFKVEVCRITVEKHPDPEVERLEIARVGDFMTVVGKGNHQTGDLVAYIPEHAIVPDAIAQEIGVLGKLSGSQKNRVRPMRLRGVVSEGLVLKAREGWVEGQDVTEELGIVKYEPPIPEAARGKFGGRQSGNGMFFHFDVDNIKKYPNVFKEGEEVIFTEKIHGTCFITGWHATPPNGVEDMFPCESIGGVFQLGTKNLSKIGVYFGNREENLGNVYCRTFSEHQEAITKVVKAICLGIWVAADINPEHVFILGEVFGPGVQDLGYGGTPGELQYRVFAACYYDGPRRVWLSSDLLDLVLEGTGLQRVPILYRGPFSKEVLTKYTDGKDFSGSHIREGVIVQPAVEKTYGQNDTRALLKSVSNDYLFRKGNTTEFS